MPRLYHPVTGKTIDRTKRQARALAPSGWREVNEGDTPDEEDPDVGGETPAQDPAPDTDLEE